MTASILRDLPSARAAGASALYRLILACNAATHEGEMQLAWAPTPATGNLSAVVDGKLTYSYKVEGSEKFGDGTRGRAEPAAIQLYSSKRDSQSPGMRLPAKSLLISNLFMNESVEFSFGDLPMTARQLLVTCFK